MKKSQRLQVIVDLKSDQEEKYRQTLIQEQEKQQQKQQQLNSLINYRQDYLQKNQQQSQKGISVVRLMEFRAFIDKMEQAIAGEKVALAALDSEVSRLKKCWEEAHQHTSNMQKIQRNAQLFEQQQAEKKEQLEQDDQTAARVASRGGIDNA